MTSIDTPRLSMTRTIELRLAPEAAAVGEARRALDRLASFLLPAKLEDARLVVSELVTNSVRHGGLSPDDQISLSVRASGGSVRGRVCNPQRGFEKPWELGPRPDMTGGWGLSIVEKISDRWGIERNGKRQALVCVWFELD